MPRESATKILIITQEFDPHVDFTISLLRHFGVDCIRWPTNFFPMRSSLSLSLGVDNVDGVLTIGERRVAFGDIRSVWYRHPAPFTLPANLSEREKGFADEQARAAFSGLMHILDCFWVNHPDATRVASSKPLQLKVAQELGFSVPRTLVTNEPQDVCRFAEACGGGIIYKVFGSGFFPMTGEVCLTVPLAREHLDKINLIRSCPGIFQELIPKEVDLRITVIGRKVFAVEIHSQEHATSKFDWRAAKVEDLRHCRHAPPRSIETLCLRLLEHFGLTFGAIDMILTPDGRYVFLENNPSGQFGWIEERTGLPLTATLAEMLITGRVL